MTKPLIETVRWAVDGSDADASNVTAPSSGNRDTGHVLGAIPSSSVDNYWQNKAYRWFQYLNSGALDGDITTTGTLTVGGQLLPFTDFTFTADSTTDQLLHTAHGLLTGDGPVRVSNGGGGLPSGLVAATDYYVILVDANHLQLAPTRADAFAGFALDLLSNGTGTQTLLHQAGTTRASNFTASKNAAITGALTAGSAAIGGAAFTLASVVFTANSGTDELAVDGHGLQTGHGPLRVSNSGGALPSGLAAATDYWAIRSNSGKFKLATTFARAMSGTAIDLATAGTGTNSIVSGTSPTGAGSAAVHGNLTVDGNLIRPTQTLRFGAGGGFGQNSGSAWDTAAGGISAVPFPTQWTVGIDGLPDGYIITAVRARVKDSVTGPTTLTMIATKSVDEAETGLTGFSSQVSAGSGAWQTLQDNTVNETIASGAIYYVTVLLTSGTAAAHFQWVEVDVSPI